MSDTAGDLLRQAGRKEHDGVLHVRARGALVCSFSVSSERLDHGWSQSAFECPVNRIAGEREDDRRH